MARATKKKLIYVEWLDSYNFSEAIWKTEEDMNEFVKEPFIIVDVGFLYAEDKDYLTLVGGHTKEGMEWTETYHREIKIPRACIKKRVYLHLKGGS